ncbi:hypothetical protein [Arthrobacter ipis]|uniref:hypothetical protein n=1 Tax=Arthrobacter ipis TaxID=2716202 RepID=UPI001FEC3474|nr:hypothetical protein [Arthrobacter ipis]
MTSWCTPSCGNRPHEDAVAAGVKGLDFGPLLEGQRRDIEQSDLAVCHQTELSPTYVVNDEGLLLRAQFSQDSDGKWTASDVAWAPSVIVSAPYRWCSVAADAPQGVCASPAADADTRLRTKHVVESMGAAQAGARELLVTKER